MSECELHVKPSSVSSMPVCWCSILYQRGVYPPEDFQQQKQYGLTMMVSTEPGIKKYLDPRLINTACYAVPLLAIFTFLPLQIAQSRELMVWISDYTHLNATIGGLARFDTADAHSLVASPAHQLPQVAHVCYSDSSIP